jgi:hypothetical protein
MTSTAELNELLVSHNCLRRLSIQLNDEGLTYDVTLSMSVSENFESDVVLVRFADVSNLSSSDIGGGLTQMMHLNVSELNSGLDRIRYELNELEDNKLSFCFSSFVVD